MPATAGGARQKAPKPASAASTLTRYVLPSPPHGIPLPDHVYLTARTRQHEEIASLPQKWVTTAKVTITPAAVTSKMSVRRIVK